MSSSIRDEEEYERMPLQSLDDLPTDDSQSVGSSSDDDDTDSGDETEQHTNLTTNNNDNKAPFAYEEASSSSSSDSSSEDDSDDSSSSDSISSDEEAEEQATNRQAQEQHYNDNNSDLDSNQEEGLQNVPLEDRIRKRQEAGLFSKSARASKRQRASRALQIASERLKHDKQQEATTKLKKKSKHRPTEVSSKRSDFFKRGAPTLDSSGLGVNLTAHRYKPRDPRIMGATSKSTEALDSNYAFLQELRQKEISQLKKKIAVQKLTGKKGQKARRKLNLQRDSLKNDQEELTRLLQETAGYERAQVDLAAKHAVKRMMKQQVESGKGVYYLKKREQKKLQLEAKYDELRKRGGDKAVDKALAKRRKKNKSKDTGYLIPNNV